MDKFSIQYRVPYADTDQMGVVYYANYFVFFERLRNELLREMGLSYKTMEESGIMLPVIDASCSYKKSAYYDDILTICGWVSEVKGPRITICCEVYRDETLLASGHTVHASVNLAGKPVRPPRNITALT